MNITVHRASTNFWCVIVFGVLLGALFAAMFANGYAPDINSIFVPTAVIGLIFSIVLTILAQKQEYRSCMYGSLLLPLFSSLALLVLSVLSLATTVTPAFTSFIALVFLGATSLFISVIGLFALVKCIVYLPNDCAYKIERH